LQNVRPGATIVERVRRIQDAGLDVWCGMIVGFDHDDATVFDAQRDFLREARILHAMAGMLAAIPKTPLHARLAAEGRLDDDNENEFGSNVIPLRMTRQALRDGYVQLMKDLYEPEAYFARLDDLMLAGRLRFGRARARYWKSHPWAGLKAQIVYLVQSVFIFQRLMSRVDDPRLRAVYRRQIIRLVRRRPNPVVLFVYLIKCLTHFHHHTMAQRMAQQCAPVVNSY
jgi:hypothetical protein